MEKKVTVVFTIEDERTFKVFYSMLIDRHLEGDEYEGAIPVAFSNGDMVNENSLNIEYCDYLQSLLDRACIEHSDFESWRKGNL
jgi:hypothetical protein